MPRKTAYCYLLLVTGLFMSVPYAAPESPRDHNMHYMQDDMRDGMHKKCQNHHGRGMHAVLEKLDLSEEQRGQIDAIFQKSRSRLREKWTELRDVSQQLHALALSDSYDEGRVNSLADRKGDLVTELAKLKAAEMAKVHAVLTPEQREKMANALRQKKQDMKSRQ